MRLWDCRVFSFKIARTSQSLLFFFSLSVRSCSLRLCKALGGFVRLWKVFQSLPKPSKHILKPSKTSQTLPKPPKASQSPPGAPRTSQSLQSLGERHTMLKLKPPKASQGVSKASQSFPNPKPDKAVQSLQNLIKPPKAFRSLSKPPKA